MIKVKGYKHSQFVISKKFQNVMRQENHVLVWKEFKPTVIDDESLTVEEFSLAKTQFFDSSKLISLVQQTIKHQGFETQ